MAGRYGLEIRGADAGDAPGLAALLAAAGLRADAPGLVRRLERLREAHAAVLVAVEWGPPTGVAVVTLRSALDADGPVAGLDLLLVDAEQRRRGVGRLLLKATAQFARQAGAVELVATTPDPAARAFAAASGFAERGAALVRPLRKGG